MILTLLLACAPTDDTTVIVPDDTALDDCADGFERAPDGNCYPVESEDTGDTGEPDDTAEDTATETGDTGPADRDGDGYAADLDCDDSDDTVHPDAAEACNERDDDCDNEVDEGLAATWYRDEDGDGYGRSTTTAEDCDAPAGYVDNDDDCDDNDDDVNPGADDDTDDNLDNDCDGVADEDWDPCATGPGSAWLETETYAANGEGRFVTPLEGAAWVCEVTCDVGWLEAELVTDEACRTPAALPYEMSRTTTQLLCVTVWSAGVRGSTGRCSASTSGGDVSVEVTWSG